MTYLLLKWIHIISATLLFGTGLGSAFFMFMANRGKDIHGIYFAVRHVVIADWLFTTPAVIVQFITGFALLHVAGYAWNEPWVLAAFSLYIFAGLCWLPVVWMQVRMRDMAKHALDTGQLLPARYWKMDKAWIILGCLAFPAVLAVFYLMVFKPAL